MQNEMRDRLIELIKKVPYGVSVGATFERYFCEKVADHLIANGATVQEWISVKDRLPESSCFVLIVFDTKIMLVLPYSAKNKAFNSFDWFDDHDFDMFPTHWMPLPEPPKGEIE